MAPSISLRTQSLKGRRNSATAGGFGGPGKKTGSRSAPGSSSSSPPSETRSADELRHELSALVADELRPLRAKVIELERALTRGAAEAAEPRSSEGYDPIEKGEADDDVSPRESVASVVADLLRPLNEDIAVIRSDIDALRERVASVAAAAATKKRGGKKTMELNPA